MSKLKTMQTINLGQGVILDMASIPGGSFMMGSPEDEQGRYKVEGPLHQVTLDPFFMGRYPITQAQWRAVASLPQVQRELDPDPSRFKGDSRPVERVNWYEALEFCDRLAKKLGQPYTLPSEAQWEYACRAGTNTPFHFGETITTDLANFYSGLQGDYLEETTEVGSFSPNAWGFCDMHGNVWEWCLDYYHNSYRDAPPDGSAWETEGDSYRRILRGGSWFSASKICRAAFRNAFCPNIRLCSYGFRVVSVPPRTLVTL